RNKNLAAQQKLYTLYYSYGMSISLRYSNNKEEAEDILNDAFYNFFVKIDLYDTKQPFKYWFRRILINASIDYTRRYKKFESTLSLEEGVLPAPKQDDPLAFQNLAYQDVLKQIQKLPPAYQLVFNLYAIDGLKHQEIADRLEISVNTSKSNYSRARSKLQEFLKNSETTKGSKYG
ncbi:MAG: RNA polymerase sigma factor (sigma-70 family), partial [Flavobacteriales bacterium]